MLGRKRKLIALLENELDAKISKPVVYYNRRSTALAEAGGELYLCTDGRVYSITSSPYEPCTYLSHGGSVCTVIHNAFTADEIAQAARRRGTLTAITGTVYDTKRLCQTLAFAAERFSDADIGYVEGAFTVEQLKALKATSPNRAVKLKKLGVKNISDRFSRSKKLSARVMYTEDGKVYLKIKE